MLKKYHPVYVNTHFNHPWEITDESSRACELLADNGVPVGNQMVIMKDINDDPAIVKELMQKLLKIRVRHTTCIWLMKLKGQTIFVLLLKQE